MPSPRTDARSASTDLAALHIVLTRWFASEEAYEVLDANTDTHGCTWMSGGCGVAARALVAAVPGATLAEIVDLGPKHRYPVSHHFVAFYQGRYLDADGVSTQEQLLERWHSRESLAEPAIRPCDLELLFESGVPGGWNSALRREDSDVVATHLRAQPDWPSTL